MRNPFPMRHTPASPTAQSPSRLRGGRDSLVRGFLLSYLLVLVLPTLTGVALYLLASQTLQDQTDKTNLIRLHDAESITRQQISTMISFVDRMAMNHDVTILGTMDPRRQNTTDILRVKEAAEAVRRYNDTNPLIEEYYIHYNRNDITISSTDAFLDFNRFYGTYFQWGDMDAAEWTAFAAQNRHERQLYPARAIMKKSGETEENGRALLYLQSMPLGLRSRTDGYLAVIVNEQEVQRLLAGLDLGEGGMAVILDRNRSVMTGLYAKDAPAGLPVALPDLPDHPEGHRMLVYDGVRYSVTFVRSDTFGWTYLSAIPTRQVYDRMWRLGLAVGLGFLLTLVCGAILALWLSRRNARPWREIANAVGLVDAHAQTGGLPTPSSGLGNPCDTAPGSPETPHGLFHAVPGPRGTPRGWLDPSDQIRGQVLRMAQNSRELAQMLENQLPIVQAAFLSRLLTGRFMTKLQLDRNMHLAKLELDAPAWIVLVFRLDRNSPDPGEAADRRTLLRFWFQERIREQYGCLAPSSDTQPEEGITILLPLPTADRDANLDALRLTLLSWHTAFRQTHHLYLKTAVGQPCTSLLDVHRSFEEARLALAHARYDAPFWHADLPKGTKPYFFPFELENQILHQVWSGNTEAVHALFDRLLEENTVQRTLPPSLADLLAAQLCGTLIHLLERSSYDVSLLLANIETMHGRSLPEVLECARTICETMAEKANACQQHKEDELKDAIIASVRESHADPCFCLADLKDRFPLTATAINALFLERTGMTFSNYLESFRLEQACELLQKGAVSIQEVAGAVGYTSAHSFRRAFKRRYNLLPTEYQIHDG